MNTEAIKTLNDKLNNMVGNRIDTLCQSTVGNSHNMNQCAYFVSYVLDYDLDKKASCKNFTLADKDNDAIKGAKIRLDVIFNKFLSHQRHQIEANACHAPSLIYVTRASNITASGKMGSALQKHIGILIWPWVLPLREYFRYN